MKKQLLTALVVAASLCGYAQTKGTNALGLGIYTQTYKNKYSNGSGNETTEENKYNSYALSYGLFIKDNTKIGLEFNYGDRDNSYVANASGSKTKTYGGGVNYQYYYPLVQRLYAYAGGRLSYSYSKEETAGVSSNIYTTNQYGLGAYGGVTWFVSKRFALETSLLSADAFYAKSKRKYNPVTPNSNFESTSSMFNLSSNGSLSNLGFKVYILF